MFLSQTLAGVASRKTHRHTGLALTGCQGDIFLLLLRVPFVVFSNIDTIAQFWKTKEYEFEFEIQFWQTKEVHQTRENP